MKFCHRSMWEDHIGEIFDLRPQLICRIVESVALLRDLRVSTSPFRSVGLFRVVCRVFSNRNRVLVLWKIYFKIQGLVYH